MNDQPCLTLGADVGGTHIEAGAARWPEAELIEEARCSIMVDASQDAETILTAWVEAIGSVLDAIAGLNRPCQGLGMAVPGPFDAARGRFLIRGLEKFEALYGVDLVPELVRREPRLAAMPIIFENDAVAYLIGEAIGGAARDWRRFIGLTLGTGMGSAFIEDRKAVTGGPVTEDGFLYHVPWNGKIADDWFSTRGLLERYEMLTGERLANGRELASRAEQADQYARVVFLAMGKELGDFLEPWVNRFKAEGVVIGGNLIKAADWFWESLSSSLERNVGQVALRKAELLERAPLLGAAHLPTRNPAVH